MQRFSLMLAIVFGMHSVSAAADQHLYWTDFGAGKIVSANLDGSNVVDLLTGVLGPSGIALDEVHQKVYWTSQGTGHGAATLQRANLDGSDVESVLADLYQPEGVAIDPLGGYAYFTDRDDRGIYRVGLDGTGETLLIDTDDLNSNPLNLKLDLVAGKIYWAEDGNSAISVANLDGSDAHLLVSAGGGFDIGLDTDANHLFWTNYGTHEIHRADLDGTNQQLIVSGLGEAQGLALDAALDNLYFAEFSTGRIRSVATDGSGLHDIYSGGVSPRSVAIGVPEPSTWTLALALIGTCLVWKSRQLQGRR